MQYFEILKGLFSKHIAPAMRFAVLRIGPVIQQLRVRCEPVSRFIHQHFPRDHMYVAAGLTAFLLVALMLPEGTGANAGTRTRIDVPVAQQLAETIEASEIDFTVASINAPNNVATASDQGEAETARADTLAIPSDWHAIEVRDGDSLSTLFSQVGLNDGDLFQVLNSSDEARVLNRIYPGNQLEFRIPEPGKLEQLKFLQSPLSGYVFTLQDATYQVEQISRTPLIEEQFKVGTITDSLFMAGQRENIPAIHIMEMANVFGGVIDFILDPRLGDQFSILYEEKYLDGEFVGNGQILATQFVNQGRVYTAVRYIDEDGEVGYYSPEGESMRKAFLRNPLDVFRISSNFNPSRRHPILNTIRAHKGTDYAAPTGTPVRATSDGTITHAGRYGSFGNLVVIKHSGGFETKYAHLSKYGNGVKKGRRIRQGDVIGYVGATGGATGPHLHYEFLMHGVHQNPRTVHHKLPKAEAISEQEMARFREQTAPLLQQFKTYQDTRILTLNQPSAD